MTHARDNSSLPDTPEQEDASWWTRLRAKLAEVNSREDYGTKLYP
ncbi:hypothetical protein SAMN04489765_3804 [Tsukamurella pulmonis]|uniref:Uncharacterized protein n=1 Tax=Tsukamurella pulmonis TaxID=47312 RepID=A0A1H1H477_9ACTN|nr:hypothetical protein SAMN04489765_3804 [Tsukamurella pulmonis]SUP15986.1 Uncharacterised protein [Tsukamurella pulmonis]